MDLCLFLELRCLLQAYLHGVLPVQKACFASLEQNALGWSNRLKQVFATCHSLHMVNKSIVTGVDVEQTLFKAVEARFLVSWTPSRLLVGM